jgi:hypothetical protein
VNTSGFFALLSDCHDIMCYMAWAAVLAVLVALFLVWSLLRSGAREGEAFDKAIEDEIKRRKS